ncbi:MAG: efflux RND transporter periplasmic adaptor subunit [Spirochaetes bacterium]|nr:efflux RND transporter periplasmic adaptor subunit [Spirochaetota bacterium]
MFRINNKKLLPVIIIIIAVITYFFLRGCNKNIGLVYRYDKASKGEVQKTISVSGTLEVLKSHAVLSKISGIVTDVYVDYNSKVEKNQLLAKLDATGIEQEIQRIDVKRKQISLELLKAKSDRDAKLDLLKENLISKKGLENAELQYKQVANEWNAIQNEYEIAKNSKSYTRITSPSSGMVISKDVEPNIPITQNKVLFVIAEDLKKMQLIIQVDESDIGYIKNNQNVHFSVSAFPEKVFEGRITQVRFEPIRKGQLVSYQALVTCDNSELQLKPGMTATATVDVAYKKNVLRIPTEAFIVSPVEIPEDDNGKKFVWKKRIIAIKELPVERVEVKTGLTGDYFTEIISDKIKEGDEILVGINKGVEVKESIRR